MGLFSTSNRNTTASINETTTISSDNRVTTTNQDSFNTITSITDALKTNVSKPVIVLGEGAESLAKGMDLDIGKIIGAPFGATDTGESKSKIGTLVKYIVLGVGVLIALLWARKRFSK